MNWPLPFIFIARLGGLSRGRIRIYYEKPNRNKHESLSDPFWVHALDSPTLHVCMHQAVQCLSFFFACFDHEQSYYNHVADVNFDHTPTKARSPRLHTAEIRNGGRSKRQCRPAGQQGRFDTRFSPKKTHERLLGRPVGKTHSGGVLGSVRSLRMQANLVQRIAGQKGGSKSLR